MLERKDFAQRFLDLVRFGEVLLLHLFPQTLGGLGSGFHTEVGEDQNFFQLIIEIVIDLREGEGLAEGILHGLDGLGQALLDLIKKSHGITPVIL
jgi:hypothetical protein